MTLRGVSSRKRVCFLSQRPRSNATSATTQKWSLANSSDGSATCFSRLRLASFQLSVLPHFSHTLGIFLLITVGCVLHLPHQKPFFFI